MGKFVIDATKRFVNLMMCLFLLVGMLVMAEADVKAETMTISVDTKFYVNDVIDFGANEVNILDDNTLSSPHYIKVSGKYEISDVGYSTDHYVFTLLSSTKESVLINIKSEPINPSATGFKVSGNGEEQTPYTFQLVNDGTIAVRSIEIPNSLSLTINGKQQIVPTIHPTAATNQDVSWSISPDGVATVETNGMVTGVSKGTATITARVKKGTTDEDYAISTCTVEVVEADVTQYTITSSSFPANSGVVSTNATAAEGDTVALTATPESGYQFVRWDVKKENQEIISVSDNMFTMPASNVTVTGVFEEIPQPHMHGETKYTAWTSENSLPNTAGYYYLTQNVTLSEQWTTPNGTTYLCLNGKDIIANHGGDSSHGVIRVNDSTILHIDDCSNSGRITHADNCNGSGIIVSSRGTLYFEGGIVTGNRNTDGQNGSGIYNFGTVYMSGGEISTNHSGSSGGGIYVVGSANLYLSGGIIQNNTCNPNNFYKGGGIAVQNNSGNVAVSGNVTITNNTQNGVANNLSIGGNKKITINDILSSNAKIGITLETPGVFTTGLKGKGRPSNFTSDNGGYSVYWNNEETEATLINSGDDHNITVSAGPNGQITQPTTSTTANAGTIIDVRVDPDNDYVLDALTVAKKDHPETSVKVYPDSNEPYHFTFDMPDYDVTVTATFTKAYDLWVNGTQVTDANKTDIPVTSGAASYDPATKTLSLNNAVITRVGETKAGIDASGTGEGVYNLTIIGKATIDLENDVGEPEYGIYVDGKLTIKDEDENDTNIVVEEGKIGTGIRADSIEIQGGTASATASALGIESDGLIDIKGGRIIAKVTGQDTGELAIRSVGQIKIAETHSITKPIGGSIDSKNVGDKVIYYIKNADGTVATDVVIEKVKPITIDFGENHAAFAKEVYEKWKEEISGNTRMNDVVAGDGVFYDGGHVITLYGEPEATYGELNNAIAYSFLGEDLREEPYIYTMPPESGALVPDDFVSIASSQLSSYSKSSFELEYKTNKIEHLEDIANKTFFILWGTTIDTFDLTCLPLICGNNVEVEEQTLQHIVQNFPPQLDFDNTVVNTYNAYWVDYSQQEPKIAFIVKGGENYWVRAGFVPSFGNMFTKSTVVTFNGKILPYMGGGAFPNESFSAGGGMLNVIAKVQADHDWAEWGNIKKSSDTVDGIESRICKTVDCEASETQHFKYSISKGSGLTWTKGSASGPQFEFKRSVRDDVTFSNTVSVSVDGYVVNSGNYDSSKGSLKLTLKPVYLNMQSTGEHTLKITFKDGEISTKFTIKDKPSSGGSSKKSDTVVTCQMAGFPANYAWNEAAKACQPGYIDAGGNFHPYRTVRRTTPNTSDNGNLTMYTIAMFLMTFVAYITAKKLTEDSRA